MIPLWNWGKILSIVAFLMGELIASLREVFDRVIIDTCPISVGADASVIASRVDGTLYVVDERTTKQPQAQAGLNQLNGVRARLLGIVLNRSKLVGTDSYYYQDEPPVQAKRDRAARVAQGTRSKTRR